MGDLVRGALQSIPVIQWESAQALGMKPIQVYTLVILPQTVRRLIPLSINLITRMVTTTSPVMMIGILEVLQVAQDVYKRQQNPLKTWLMPYKLILHPYPLPLFMVII